MQRSYSVFSTAHQEKQSVQVKHINSTQSCNSLHNNKQTQSFFINVNFHSGIQSEKVIHHTSTENSSQMKQTPKLKSNPTGPAPNVWRPRRRRLPDINNRVPADLQCNNVPTYSSTVQPRCQSRALQLLAININLNNPDKSIVPRHTNTQLPGRIRDVEAETRIQPDAMPAIQRREGVM